MTGELLTPQELATELGIKLSTIYHWTHIGYIPVVRVGRLLRFRRSSLAGWLNKLETPGRRRKLSQSDI